MKGQVGQAPAEKFKARPCSARAPGGATDPSSEIRLPEGHRPVPNARRLGRTGAVTARGALISHTPQ